MTLPPPPSPPQIPPTSEAARIVEPVELPACDLPACAPQVYDPPICAPLGHGLAQKIPAEFEAAAGRMAPLARSLLMDGVDPRTVPVESLLVALGRRGDHAALRAAHKEYNVIRRLPILTPASCATLREVVDRERRIAADSVDECPEHQRNLSAEELERLIGPEEHGKLMSLVCAYDDENRLAGTSSLAVDEESIAKGVATLREAFVRRYSADTRPFNPFHQDAYRVTVNVALSADAAHTGGRLLGVCAGKVQVLERDEGECSVHCSELLHAVSRMTSGVRYSLILFFDERPRIVRKDGLVQSRWAQRRWKPPAGNARWWE